MKIESFKNVKFLRNYWMYKHVKLGTENMEIGI